MKIKLPDYNNCLTNLASSILKEFDIDTNKQTLEIIDKYLKKGHQNIILIVLDGMGTNIIEKNLEPEGFFHSHLVTTISSTFPPTTVAATTSLDSGLEPCEHSWLGWDCYYPQIDQNVTVFRNVNAQTGKLAAKYNVANTYCGYDTIRAKINQNKQQAYILNPFVEPYPQDLAEICDKIKSLTRIEGKKYIYAYWMEPDTTMHKEGCYGIEAKKILKELERKIEKLCLEVKDSLFIITADHGHIDSKAAYITDYPKIMECLIRMPSIEPRALNLFVKPEKKEQFEKEFDQEFKGKFWLLTKEEVLKTKLFGQQKEHPNFQAMLGDYLAIAISDLSIYNSKETLFKGVHAGLTKSEMQVPLIIVET